MNSKLTTYATSAAASHVGIYMGGGRMIDASSSSGCVVIRSSIYGEYWSTHFLMGYRIWEVPPGCDTAAMEVVHPELKGSRYLKSSDAHWLEALDKAGVAELDAPRRMMRVTREFSLEQNGKSIAVKPYDGFRVDYTIRFPHPVIGEQRFVLDISPETFRKEIADARTFGFFREAEYLRSRGLARGCSLDNVIVIDDNGVMNEGGLRFPDEFVRHKILDFIGDMAMLGKPMLGDFTVSCSGHAHNNAFLRQLSQLEGALEAVEF